MRHSFGGPWTQIKLDLLRRYLISYNKALQNKPSPQRQFTRIYIDAFAGTGECEIRTDEQTVATIAGSAKIALETVPAFDEVHLVDLNPAHVEELNRLASMYSTTVEVHLDEANSAINKLLARNWKNSRGVIFLDPYGMTVPWTTLERIAATKALDVWYLFPLSAIYRQAATNFAKVDPGKAKALDAVLGTQDWRVHFYQEDAQAGLLSAEQDKVRTYGSTEIALYVRDRLAQVFIGWVSEPLYLRSTKDAPLFALFCCISNPAPSAVDLAKRIANHILEKFGSPAKRKTSKPTLSNQSELF